MTNDPPRVFTHDEAMTALVKTYTTLLEAASRLAVIQYHGWRDPDFADRHSDFIDRTINGIGEICEVLDEYNAAMLPEARAVLRPAELRELAGTAAVLVNRALDDDYLEATPLVDLESPVVALLSAVVFAVEVARAL